MDEKYKSPIGSADKAAEIFPKKDRQDVRSHGDGLSRESAMNNEDNKLDEVGDVGDTLSSINDSGIENLASSVATTCFSVENEVAQSEESQQDIEDRDDDTSSDQTALLLAECSALNQASSCGSELSGYTTSSMELPVYTSSECASVTRDEYRSDSIFNVDEEDEIRANSSVAVAEFLDNDNNSHSPLEDSTTVEIKNLEEYIDKMMHSVVDVGSITDKVKSLESTSQFTDSENIVAQNLAQELCDQVPGFNSVQTVNIVSLQIAEEMGSDIDRLDDVYTHGLRGFVNENQLQHNFIEPTEDISEKMVSYNQLRSDQFLDENLNDNRVVASDIASDIIANYPKDHFEEESSNYKMPSYTIHDDEENSALIEMYSNKLTARASSPEFQPPSDQVPFAEYCLHNIESGNFDKVPSPNVRRKMPGNKSFVEEVRDALTNEDLESVQLLMENVHDKDEARWMMLFDMLENQHVRLLAQQAREHHNSLQDLHCQLEEQRKKLSDNALTYQQRLAAYSKVLTDCRAENTAPDNCDKSPVNGDGVMMSSSPIKLPNVDNRISPRGNSQKYERRSPTKIHAPTLEKYEARISPIRPETRLPKAHDISSYTAPVSPLAVKPPNSHRDIDLETSVMKALNFPPRTQKLENDKSALYSPKEISPRSAYADTRYHHPQGGHDMQYSPQFDSTHHRFDQVSTAHHHQNNSPNYTSPRDASQPEKFKTPRGTWSGAYRISKTQTAEPLRCFSPVSHTDTVSTDELFLVIPGPQTYKSNSLPEVDKENVAAPTGDNSALVTPQKSPQNHTELQESPLNTTFTLTPGKESYKETAENAPDTAVDSHGISDVKSEDSCSFINSSASTRMHLREKHARHMADLRSFYEAEISELKDQLHAIQETNAESHNLRQRLLEREMEEKSLYMEKRLKASKEHSDQVEKHLQEQQNELHDKQRRIWELEYLVDDSERRYNQTQTALDAGKLMNEQVSRLLKEKDAQIIELQGEIRRLKLAYEDAQRLVDDYEKVRRERRSAQTALSSAEAVIFDTKSELSEYKSRVAKMEIEQKRLERENDMLHKRLNQARLSDRTQEAQHIDGLWSDFSKRPKSISDMPYSGRITSPLRENLRSQALGPERAMHIFKGGPSPRRSNRLHDEDIELRTRVAEVLAGNKTNMNRASPTKLLMHNESQLSSNRSTYERQTNGIIENNVEKITTTETSPPTRDTNSQNGHGENKENELHIDLTLLNDTDKTTRKSVETEDVNVSVHRSEEVFGAMSPEPRLSTSPHTFAAVRPTVSFTTPTSSLAFKPISQQEHRKSPNISELPVDTNERWKVISSLEKKFDELQMEKRTVEAALSHVPVSGARANRHARVEKERLEDKLDQIDKDLGSLRMTLKRYHVLKSTI